MQLRRGCRRAGERRTGVCSRLRATLGLSVGPDPPPRLSGGEASLWGRRSSCRAADASSGSDEAPRLWAQQAGQDVCNGPRRLTALTQENRGRINEFIGRLSSSLLFLLSSAAKQETHPSPPRSPLPLNEQRSARGAPCTRPAPGGDGSTRGGGGWPGSRMDRYGELQRLSAQLLQGGGEQTRKSTRKHVRLLRLHPGGFTPRFPPSAPGKMDSFLYI